MNIPLCLRNTQLKKCIVVCIAAYFLSGCSDFLKSDAQDSSTGYSNTSSPTGENPYKGYWAFLFNGIASGTGNVPVDGNGEFSQLVEIHTGINFYTLSGKVDAAGKVNAALYDDQVPVGMLSGTLTKLNGYGTLTLSNGKTIVDSWVATPTGYPTGPITLHKIDVFYSHTPEVYSDHTITYSTEVTITMTQYTATLKNNSHLNIKVKPGTVITATYSYTTKRGTTSYVTPVIKILPATCSLCWQI